MTNNAQTRNGCAPLVAECIKGTKLLVFIVNAKHVGGTNF